jgi:TP901 family phage tail tape measure protein
LAIYSLGQAVGEIRINTADSVRSYAKLRAEHSTTMTSLERGSVALRKVGFAMGGIGAAALIGFGLAVKATSQFEKELSFFQAVTNANGREMDLVRQKAFELGRTSGKSAQEIATAFVELGKAGVGVKQLVGGVADATIALAQAADISASEAASTIVSVTSTFQLAAKDAAHVANVLAGAANASIIDIQDLAYSMKYAGSTAHALGIPFESVSAALAILGNNGIRGSTAGTSLRRILISLSPASDKAATMMKKLGIITKKGSNEFFTAKGHAKSLAQISQVLQDRLKGLSDKQKVQALNTIFGNRAIASALILAKGGAKAFGLMDKQMARTTAAQVMNKRLDNLNGAWMRFKAAINVAMIQAGTPAQKPLQHLVEYLTKLVNWFAKLTPQQQQFIVKMVLITSGLLAASGAFILTVSYVLRLVKAFKDFGMAMKFIRDLTFVTKGLSMIKSAFQTLYLVMLMNPFIALAVAVVAVGVGLYILYKKWKPFRDLVNSVASAIKGGLLVAFHALVRAAKTTINWIMSHWKLLVTVVTAAASVILGPWLLVLGLMVTHWRGVWTAIKAVWKAIVAVISVGIAVVKAVINAGMTAVTAVWRVFWAMFGAVLTSVWGLIKAVVGLGMEVLKILILIPLVIIYQVWRLHWNLIKAIVPPIWHAIVAVVKWAWSIISPLISAGISFIHSTISTGMSVISSVWSAVWGAITAVVVPVWSAIKSVVSTGVSYIKTVISGLKAIISWFSEPFHKAYTAVSNWIGQIIKVVGTIAGKILNAVKDFGHLLWDAGVKLMTGLIDGITSKINDIKNLFEKLTRKLTDWKGPKRVDLRLLFPSGQYIMDGLLKGLQSGVGGIQSFLGTVTKRIAYYINRAKALNDTKSVRALEVMNKQVQAYGTRLVTLAKKRDGFIAKIKAQQQKLSDLLQAKADFAAGIRDAISQLGDVTQVVSAPDASGNPLVTGDTIVAGLQQQLAAIQEFHTNLNKLRKMGLSNQAYLALLQEGPQQAGPYVNALVSAGQDAVGQVNSLQSQINAEAKKMGDEGGSAMYDAGINATKGLIQGLQKNAGLLYKVMQSIAQQMVKTLKKELGIRSPSRVLFQQGNMSGVGLVLGLRNQVRHVKREALRLSRAALPNVKTMPMRGAGISAASLRAVQSQPVGDLGRDVQVTQNIKSIEPKKAADESARRMRGLAEMGAFSK